jgi:hypothetical protein
MEMLPAHLRSPRIKIEVSKDIINAAKPGDAAHCMIAESIRAEYPAARWVLVDLQSIRFTDRGKGSRYIYMTPRAVQRRVVNFEQGVKPAPFSFLLAEGKVRAVSKKPVKAASPKRRKAAAKGQRIQKARIKPKSTVLADRQDIAPNHKRQFGIRAL